MEKIFPRRHLGRDIDTLSLRLCLLGGSQGSFKVGVRVAEEGEVVCLVFEKNRKYEWDREQEEAFHTLKDNLCNTPILSLPDGPEDFVVYCDASNQGLGCIHMQRGKSVVKRMILVAYSKAFKEDNATTKMMCGLDQLMERKEDGGMYFIWVPLIGDVRTLIMDEAYASRYLVHPGADKTYYDLGDMYGGHVIKDIATYVSNCLTCLKVNAETSKTFGFIATARDT
ncbi:putative reverse transcriptase domain-containing protein [Tanacetum coccineum]|uniref:Reverse transcriptase domain-containing protein n=1 Tax=Tanacetum coccineum TaxID=301880 RepID=A0ABQ5DLW5_9ASTR